ncbi:MAG: precorrin-2 C(20)-methyltransferase [Firmicutes bacterium]|nr:precorrin-2 C(20)-methyltransferase [Bacillota bacterium]
MSGFFYGVGLGPGDPELITVKALKILKAVDRIVAPVSRDGLCLAGNILNDLGFESKTEYLSFPRTNEVEELIVAWEDAVLKVKTYLKEYDVAFVTMGDPLLYGSYLYFFRLLQIDPGFRTQIETIPGVMGMSASAAQHNFYLTKGDDRLIMITGKISKGEFETYCNSFETIVIYNPPVCPVDILRIFYRLCPMGRGILAENTGIPDERIISLRPEIYPTDTGYYTTIILRTGLDRRQT